MLAVYLPNVDSEVLCSWSNRFNPPALPRPINVGLCAYILQLVRVVKVLGYYDMSP